MKSSSFGQLLLLGALWGAAFMFMRVAVPEFGAFSMAAARVGLACVIMLVLVAVLRHSMDFRHRWKTYLAIGAVNTAIPFVAYSFAAQHIPAGYSAIANSTTPVWSALIMWLWFKEPLGALKWTGIVFAFCGVLVLVGLQPVALTPLVIAGIVAAVMAASMYASASFLIKRYLSEQSGLAAATGMVWGAAVWLLLPGIYFAPASMPSVTAWGALLAMSVLCTVAAYALFFHLIKTIGPQRASSVAFLFPAFAAFWGWLILSEPITTNMIAGMLFVLIGTALVSSTVAESGPPTLWDRVRDTLVLPLAFALAPGRLRRWLASAIARSDRVFRHEIASARAGYVQANLPQPVDEVIARLRLIRVIDYADMWLSLLRSDKWVRKHLRVNDAARTRDEAALFLVFHYGGGWWMARYFRMLGERISIVMFRGAPGPRIAERYQHAWGILRLKWIERICRSPLIVTDDGGAGRKMRDVWQRGAGVYIASDMPPVLVRDSIGVPFFGRTGYFPVRPLQLAADCNVPVYAIVCGWNLTSFTPTLEFLRLEGDSPEARLVNMVALQEARIRAHPGAWHLWGEWPLFFEPSPKPE